MRLPIITSWVLMVLGAVFIVSQSPRLSAEEIKQAGPPPAQDVQKFEELTIRRADGTTALFHVEMARTPAEQAFGLMYRKEMANDKGMLFVFPTEDERAFWMKNTYLPLDMVFIRADGTIHSIHPYAVPHDLTPVRSYGPVMAVLEIMGGQAKAQGIKVGDRVLHKVFASENVQKSAP